MPKNKKPSIFGLKLATDICREFTNQVEQLVDLDPHERGFLYHAKQSIKEMEAELAEREAAADTERTQTNG